MNGYTVTTIDAYELLANMIIYQAAEDYIAAWRAIHRRRPLARTSRLNAEDLCRECQEFFLEGAFQKLNPTGLNGEVIIELLNDMAKSDRHMDNSFVTIDLRRVDEKRAE